MQRRVRKESISEQQALVAFLRKLFGEFKFYQDLNLGLQTRVLEIVGHSEYEDGEIIFEQGDDADLCYILLSGEVEIWRRDDQVELHREESTLSRSDKLANISRLEASRVASKMASAVHELIFSDPKRHCVNRPARKVEDSFMLGQRVAVLPPGIMFGEVALLDDAPRNASAVCGDDCTFLTIQKHDFDNIVKHELKNARSKALSALARPLLINFPFYQELDPEVQDAVPEILYYKQMKQGDVLFRQNDAPDMCYIILTGEVAIWKDLEQPMTQRQIPETSQPTLSSPDYKRLTVEAVECHRNLISATTSGSSTESLGPRRVASQNESAVLEALNGEFVQMLKESDAELAEDVADVLAVDDQCDLGLHIAILESGILFGEQSLLNDLPRNASASCFEDCEFLVIRKADFQNVLKKVMQTSATRTLPHLVLPLLAEIPLFQSLPSEVRGNLPYAMKNIVKKRGTVLFWQGEPPGDCYIILSGAVDVFAESVEDSISWSSTTIRTTFGSDTLRRLSTNIAYRLEESGEPKKEGHKLQGKAKHISRVLKTSKTRHALAATERAYGLKIGVLGQGVIFGRRGTAAESQEVTAVCAEDCRFLVIEKRDFDSMLKHELKTVKLRQHELQVRRLLQEFAIFHRFTPNVQARIPSVVNYFSASSGDALYYEGDAAGPCYIILAGKVMVWKRITCPRGSVFEEDEVICKCCGAQRPQGPLACECGNFLMDDANFCRKCGKPRQVGERRLAHCPECDESVPIDEMDEHRIQHINDRRNIRFQLQTGKVDILRAFEFVSKAWHPDHHDEPIAEFKDPAEADVVLQDLAALFKIYLVGAEIVRRKYRKINCHKGGHLLPEQKKWHEELAHNRHYLIKEKLILAGVPENLINARVEEGHDEKIYVQMYLVENSSSKPSPVEKPSAAAFRKCEGIANMLAEMTCHVPQCACGNVFSDDSLFCRFCGTERPGGAPLQGVIPDAVPGSVPAMTLGPGAILGQLALVEDGLRDASVICTRDCEFLRIESAELAEIQKIELQRTEKEQQQTLEFFYHHLPLLQSLPETTALATVEHFEKHEFPLRHVFFQQEEHGDGAYYLIMNGSVELFVADTPQFFDYTHLPHTGFRRLGMLMKGCLFASNGPKGKEAFTAVVASSPCEIWRLGRGNFKHVPEVILKALHELSDQNTLWRMSRVGSLPILEATGSHGTLGLDYRPHTTLKGPPLGLRLNWNSRPSQTLRASAYQTSNSFIGKLPQVSRSPKARSCARTAGSWRPQDSQLKLTTRDPFLPPEPEYVEFVMTPGACLALHGRRPKKRAHKLALSRPASLPHLR